MLGLRLHGSCLSPLLLISQNLHLPSSHPIPSSQARRVVAEKRLQLAIEAETVQHARMAGLLIPAQRLFRKFSTRLWFAQRGQVFKLFRARPKKRRMRLKGEAPAIPFADTAARAAYEVQQRRASARSAQMETLLDRYGTCLAFLETNIAHWREMDARLPPVIARLDEVRDRRSAEHDKESQTTAALKATLPPHEYELLEKQVRCVHALFPFVLLPFFPSFRSVLLSNSVVP